MVYVTAVFVNDNPVVPHSWETVNSELLRLKHFPHRTIFLGGPEGQMIIEFVGELGFYVSAFGQRELEEWLALDEAHPSDWIYVDISGHFDKVPRNVLVSEEIVMDAANEFYFSGKRKSERSWVRSIDLM